MYKSLRQFTTPILIIGGLLLVLYGTNASKLQWLGLDWNYFFSNLGLYVAVVVALQWYYDQHTKRDLLMEVTEATISNVNVARSGIDDFVEMTRNIRYEQMLLNSEVVVIGFHHNPRIIDQYIKELEERVRTGKKTTVLLSNPNGRAIRYLSKFEVESDHIKPDIRKIFAKLSTINQIANAKTAIKVKVHDTILRYSFVYTIEGVWIKPYRNSSGRDNTPGIFVRSWSPLYEFHKRDINELLEGAVDV